MQKKKWVTIILSVILFISIGILGVANVYRVDEVSVRATTISEQAEEEAVKLQEELQKIYVKEKGSNMLFVDREVADITLEQFPYFRITGFRKDFPNRIVIDVKEDEEMFAVQEGDNYHILSADGVYLTKRDTVQGRTANKPNIVVTGLTIDCAYGQVVSNNDLVTGFVDVVKAMVTVDGMEGSLRGNVLEVAVSVPAPSDGLTLMTLKMREGLTGEIYSFGSKSTEKASAFINAYLNLEDYQKVSGKIVVSEVNGIVRTTPWSAN